MESPRRCCLNTNSLAIVYSSRAVDAIVDVNGDFAAPDSRYDYTYDGDGLRRTKAWNYLPATYRYSLAEPLPMLLEWRLTRFGGRVVAFG